MDNNKKIINDVLLRRAQKQSPPEVKKVKGQIKKFILINIVLIGAVYLVTSYSYKKPEKIKNEYLETSTNIDNLEIKLNLISNQKDILLSLTFKPDDNLPKSINIKQNVGRIDIMSDGKIIDSQIIGENVINMSIQGDEVKTFVKSFSRDSINKNINSEKIINKKTLPLEIFTYIFLDKQIKMKLKLDYGVEQ